MSGALPRGLRRRGTKGIWQHTRRVPARYAHLETRKLIRTSLHTQDLSLALAKASQIELLQNEEWELALQNPSAPGTWTQRTDKLRQIAQLRGFAYLPMQQVANLPIHEICERIEKADQAPLAAPTILGSDTSLKVSTKNWLETFQEHIAEKLKDHFPEQRQRWQITRIRVVKRFVAAVGHQSIQEISRSQTLKFRRWWRKRMDERNLSANTANKDFT